MGKSAKLHKRVSKKAKSSSSLTQGPQSQPQQTVQAAKKRANIKAKAPHKNSNPGQPVLGGADYVSLMMGGRRKAKEEAKKLPKDD